MQPTKVEDSENAYRSIRVNRREYARVGGVVRFSASAFDDRAKKPSVDRSSMRNKPEDARKSPTDGVTQIGVKEIRSSCKIPIVDEKGKQTGAHAVDVVHRPICKSDTEPENHAHCQVECAPQIESGARFKKLKEALAVLANRHGFVVQPVER